MKVWTRMKCRQDKFANVLVEIGHSKNVWNKGLEKNEMSTGYVFKRITQLFYYIDVNNLQYIKRTINHKIAIQ